MVIVTGGRFPHVRNRGQSTFKIAGSSKLPKKFNAQCAGMMRRIMASCDKKEIRSIGASRPDRKRHGDMRPHGPDFGNAALREAGTRKHGLEIVEIAALGPNSRPSLWAKAADIRVVRGAGMMPPAEVRAGTDGTSPEIGRAAPAGASGQEHRPLRAHEAAPRSASSGWGRSRQATLRDAQFSVSRPGRFRLETSTLRETGAGRSCRLRRRSH